MEKHSFSFPLFLAPLIIFGAWLPLVGYFYLLGVRFLVRFVVGGVYLCGIAVVFVIMRHGTPLIWRRRNGVF